MFNLKEIKELICVLNESSIEHFEFEKGDCKITLKKSSAHFYDMTRSESPMRALPENFSQKREDKEIHDVKAEVIDKKSNIYQVLSPMVGTFYAAPSPDDEPFVKIGDKVTEKKIVCMIEAMKLYNEIEAEQAGEVVEIHVKNGQLVEFGQPLLSIKI